MQKYHTRVTPRKKTYVLLPKRHMCCFLATRKQRQSLARHAKRDTRLLVGIKRRALQGTRSPSKQKETLTCQQVRARECVCARGPEQGRVCVREKESACDTHHQSAKALVLGLVRSDIRGHKKVAGHPNGALYFHECQEHAIFSTLHSL